MKTYECCIHCRPPKRHPGCQGAKCPDWVEANKLVEAEKEMIRKEKEKQNIIIDVKYKSLDRYRRRTGEKV